MCAGTSDLLCMYSTVIQGAGEKQETERFGEEPAGNHDADKPAKPDDKPGRSRLSSGDETNG